jgi:hypothetical protein
MRRDVVYGPKKGNRVGYGGYLYKRDLEILYRFFGFPNVEAFIDFLRAEGAKVKA